MTVSELRNNLQTFNSPSFYFCIQSEDARNKDEYEVVDIVLDTMIEYKGGFDFEEEVVERIKSEYSEYPEAQINKEIARVLKSNKKRRGVFVILG